MSRQSGHVYVSWLVAVIFALVGSPATRAEEKPVPGVIAGEVTAKPAKWRAGVLVAIEKVSGTFRPPAQPVEVDQKGMVFTPHVLGIVRGTTVKFLNSDSVRHNVFSPDGEKFDLGTWPQGESRSYTFKKSGRYQLLCAVHPEMEAFVLVVDNPYFAVTDADGKFRIDGVPPGTYTLRAWSEKLPETTQTVTVTSGATTTVQFDLKKK